MMHVGMTQLCPHIQLLQKMPLYPAGDNCFQTRTPAHTLSRGHPYPSLASAAGGFQSIIPGIFSFSNKHFRLMIKMEVGGRVRTAATMNPEGKRAFDHSKGKLVNLS